MYHKKLASILFLAVMIFPLCFADKGEQDIYNIFRELEKEQQGFSQTAQSNPKSIGVIVSLSSNELVKKKRNCVFS